MYGIPNMKLEKEVIDCRVGIMKAEKVLFLKLIVELKMKSKQKNY